MNNYLEFKAKGLVQTENLEDENRFAVSVTKYNEIGEQEVVREEYQKSLKPKENK